MRNFRKLINIICLLLFMRIWMILIFSNPPSLFNCYFPSSSLFLVCLSSSSFHSPLLFPLYPFTPLLLPSLFSFLFPFPPSSILVCLSSPLPPSLLSSFPTLLYFLYAFPPFPLSPFSAFISISLFLASCFSFTPSLLALSFLLSFDLSAYFIIKISAFFFHAFPFLSLSL